jgi:hypothetical protein
MQSIYLCESTNNNAIMPIDWLYPWIHQAIYLYLCESTNNNAIMPIHHCTICHWLALSVDSAPSNLSMWIHQQLQWGTNVLLYGNNNNVDMASNINSCMGFIHKVDVIWRQAGRPHHMNNIIFESIAARGKYERTGYVTCFYATAGKAKEG